VQSEDGQSLLLHQAAEVVGLEGIGPLVNKDFEAVKADLPRQLENTMEPVGIERSGR